VCLYMISEVYQLRVVAEDLPSVGLLQRFAWGSVRWSKMKFSPVDFGRIFIRTHFELIK
jgi:hypothetical protein